MNTPLSEHMADIATRLRWEDLRSFMLMADETSLRSAAGAQKLSVNTLRARVTRLEEAVGSPLVRRSREGISFTEMGLALANVAREMRDATLRGQPPEGDQRLVQAGEIRIGCSEAIGSFWLTPHLMELQRQLPNLTVNLLCDYDAARDRSKEVDVTLSFAMPRDPDLVVARLGTLHFMLFASQDYEQRNGLPTNLDEVKRHKFIEQVSPGVHSELLDFFIGTDRPPDFVPIRTNSSISQFWAVASGAGIAALPTYAWALTRTIVPIEIPLNLRFDMFYYFHRDAQQSPAVRTAIDWLKDAFDPVRYPWFSNEFVHPHRFDRHEAGSKVVSMYEHAARRLAG